MRYKFRSFLILAGVLLFMVVGYAAVSVTFKFEGLAKVGANEEDFRVSFTRANLDGEDVAPTVVSTDGMRLKYKTGALKLKDEKSVLEFAITNNSKLYDAKMQIKCDDVDANIASLTVNLKEDRINAGENVYGSVSVALTKDYTSDASDTSDTVEIAVSCRLVLTALERTEVGEEAPDLVDSKYRETLLNGADPVLKKGLIPVTIDNTGKVTYANVNARWYKYGEKEWANAVILKDDISKVYNVGNVIAEEDIDAYFVWIPRYKYKLWNVDQTEGYIESELENLNSQSIDIIFEDKNTEVSTGTKNGEWLTHPAFTTFDVNGMWVGKYEVGYRGATTKVNAYVSSADSSNIIIKPGVYAWTNNNVKNIFYASYNYDRAKNSHMMKNTEWGAVAYLTFSRFGNGVNVRRNNHSDLLTGYSEEEKATCFSPTNSDCCKSGKNNQYTVPYNTEIGYLASTTGNITGIYDFAGGSYEYVAGFISGNYDRSRLTDDDYNQYKDYFDVYASNSSFYTFNNRILGDATGEVGPFYWYKDGDGNNKAHNAWNRNKAQFIATDSAAKYGPWFVRGGNNYYGVLSGPFAFQNASGDGIVEHGSRLVLSI